jgi:hypothetical protein
MGTKRSGIQGLPTFRSNRTTFHLEFMAVTEERQITAVIGHYVNLQRRRDGVALRKHGGAQIVLSLRFSPK